jgi:Protein of unknown function (DUF2924)
MPRVAIGAAASDRKLLDIEIARLHDLDVEVLRARWRTIFRHKAPPHLPRHLLLRMLAYRLQANQFGDLNAALRGVLDRFSDTTTITQLAAEFDHIRPGLTPGTLLTREWNGEMQHVMVQPDGFSWRGKTYPSLSKVASAITGTKWNGPRFFGLRDRSAGGHQA